MPSGPRCGSNGGYGVECPLSSLSLSRSPGNRSWRGVSLGGWLLLEPGPSQNLFLRFPRPDGTTATCEWELLEIIRQKGRLDLLRKHRDTFIGLNDFRRIRSMGLNAVRIPFGYWIISGSLPGGLDPYDGPALEYLDRALLWAEACGLEVLLDLHACPGGESGETPCGRRQRPPHSVWQWRCWLFKESLAVLRTVASRYRDCAVVTGIAVCNEPSPSVPQEILLHYYDEAASAIRDSGMNPDTVTIVLPVFQRSLDKFAQAWASQTGGRHQNTCFEVHWYHCFENEWHGRTFVQHLRAVQEHMLKLSQYPVVVGEWSLALGFGAQPGKLSKDEMRAVFAHAQRVAYKEASHGWFFWSWSDQHSIDWDWQRSYKDGYFQLDEESLFPIPEFPPSLRDWEHDPLEDFFDKPACEPRVRLGDTIYLRAFNGRYLDVEGCHVRARYGDRGKWQQLVVCPTKVGAAVEDFVLRDGAVACLMAHNGNYLKVDGEQVLAGDAQAANQCSFIVHVEASPEVRHKSAIFLQSLQSSKVLAPNESETRAKDEIVAKWGDYGTWQRFIVEKPLSTLVTPPRPRRRSSLPGASSSTRKQVASFVSVRSPLTSRRKCKRKIETPTTQRRRSHKGSVVSPPWPVDPDDQRGLQRSECFLDNEMDHYELAPRRLLDDLPSGPNNSCTVVVLPNESKKRSFQATF